MRAGPWRAIVVIAAVAMVLVAGCATTPALPGGPVGALDAVSATSLREDGLAALTLPPTMNGANLLVAVASGDGPGAGEPNAQAQHTVLRDAGGHAWIQRAHQLVFGSIVDVYTAPGTGHDAGAALTSELTIKTGDEGHTLTVLAYRHGQFRSATARNGNFGTPQVDLDVLPGADVLTAFADGRQNTPVTPVPGFRPLNVLPVDGGPRGDHDPTSSTGSTHPAPGRAAPRSQAISFRPPPATGASSTS